MEFLPNHTLHLKFITFLVPFSKVAFKSCHKSWRVHEMIPTTSPNDCSFEVSSGSWFNLYKKATAWYSFRHKGAGISVDRISTNFLRFIYRKYEVSSWRLLKAPADAEHSHWFGFESLRLFSSFEPLNLMNIFMGSTTDGCFFLHDFRCINFLDNVYRVTKKGTDSTLICFVFRRESVSLY